MASDFEKIPDCFFEYVREFMVAPWNKHPRETLTASERMEAQVMGRGWNPPLLKSARTLTPHGLAAVLWHAKRLGRGAADPTPTLDTLPDDTWSTHVELAGRLGLESEPLRSRLNRWRADNFDGWQEVTEPKARSPKYIYRVGSIRHVLREALRTK